MPILEISPKEIEVLIKQLDPSARQKLINHLEQGTISREWDKLLADIDKRLKRHPIREEDVFKEVEMVRKARYERNKAKRYH